MSPEELLKEHKLKRTNTRVKVLELYQGVDYALSHSDVEEELQANHDRVTLWRTLLTFEEKGLLHKVYDDEGKVKYSLCSHECDTQEHHDNHLHLHCRSCRKTLCLDNIAIPETPGLAAYQIQDIYMVANGLCPACQSHA